VTKLVSGFADFRAESRLLATTSAAGHEGDECAVCLAPMLAGENVTDLPLCNHT